MKAKAIVERLLEAVDPVFFEAMKRASLEMFDDEGMCVHGGGRPDKRRVADPYDINCGYCEEWGVRVAQLYQEATGQDAVAVLDPGNVTGDPNDSLLGHVFLRFQGRFYDSECPEGVDDWRKLPLFIKQMEMESLDPSDDPAWNIERYAQAIGMEHAKQDRFILDRFRRGVKAYIKWAHTDPEMGQMYDPADIRRLNRAKCFAEVQRILAQYETEPSFLSMVAQGYFT